ncbi:MAG: TolC family protein [Pseudomonadota bacterium]
MRASRILAISTAVVLLAACASPKPLKREELVEEGRDYLARRTAEAGSLPPGWTLDAAVRRALTSHLDYRISRLEAAIATGNRKLASLDMLPQLVAEAGYRQRSNVQASVSESVDTGNVSLVPSTSSEQDSTDAQLYLNWDVVDFSMAYLRSRELGDTELAAEENRRRAVQATIRDVAYAWYQARAWQDLAPDLEALRGEVDAALKQSEEIVRQRLGDPLQAVEYRSALLLVLRRIDSVTLQLDQSRDELARILHLPAGAPVLVDPAGAPDMNTLTGLPSADVRLWQSAALVNRPEMRKTIYEARANNRAARRQMLGVFPHLSFRYGANYDSNSFLVNNNWEQGSAQLSWNILKLASIPGLRRDLRMNRELGQMRTEAMSAAVLSQVSIADKAYRRNMSSWCFSKSLFDLNQRRSELLGARSQAAAIDRLSLIRAQLDSLLLRTETGLQFAEYQKARMTLLESAGLLDIPEELQGEAFDRALTALIAGNDSGPVRSELERVASEFELSAPPAGSSTANGCMP